MIQSGKFNTTKISLFFIIIIFLILSPAFLNEKVIITGDTDDLYYALPVFDFYGNALKNKESFLWNPYLFSGFPTYLSQPGGFFDPLNIILFKYLSNFNAYYLRLGIGLFLSMFFSFLATRAFGLSILASLLVSISYLMAFHWRFIGNLLVSNTLFLLPLLFYCYQKFLKESNKKWLWIIIGGAGLGWALIAGNAQFSLYSLTLLGLYSILNFFLIFTKTKTFKNFAKFVFIPLMIITIIGFIIGLPQILPALEFSKLTIRSENLDYSLATQVVIEPGDLFLLFFPDYLYFPYLTVGRKPMYIGALSLFFSIIGLFILFKKNLIQSFKYKKEALIIFLLLLFSFLTSIKWSPIFYLMNKLPIYGLFRDSARWMFFGAWLMAFLGGYGLDLLRKNKDQDSLKKFFKYILAFVSLLCGLFIFLNLSTQDFLNKISLVINKFFSLVFYGHLGLTKDPEHYLMAINNGLLAWKEFNSLTSTHFLIPFLAIVTSSFLIYLFIWNKISWDKFKVLVILIVSLNFVGIYFVLWQLSIEKNIFYSNQVILDELGQNVTHSDFRVYSLLTHEGISNVIKPKFKLDNEEIKLLKNFQFISGRPNMHIFSKLSYIDGYDIFLTNEMKKALILLGNSIGVEDETRGMTGEGRVEALANNIDLLGMMSGKYIISDKEIMSENLKFLKVIYVTDKNLPLFLYSNERALPKYYLAKQTAIVEDAGFSNILKNYGNKFINKTYIECKDFCQENVVSPNDILDKVSSRNGYLEFELSLGGDRWLVVNESFLKGWVASIDGYRVNIHRANGFYMAVLIPKGDHKVKLEYQGFNNELKILKSLSLVEN